MTKRKIADIMTSGFNSIQDMEGASINDPMLMVDIDVSGVNFEVAFITRGVYRYKIDGVEVSKAKAVEELHKLSPKGA